MRITNTGNRQAMFSLRGLGEFSLAPGTFVDIDDKFIDIAAVELRLFDTLSLSAALGSGSSIVHGTLLDLNEDDHPQYFLADGSRALTGNLDAGSSRLTNLSPPLNGSDAVTKDFVVQVLNGVFWQDAVLDRDLVTAPLSPTDGDRYIIAGTGGVWSVGSVNDIATWSVALGQWEFATPEEGFTLYIEDENIYAHWNGSAWIKMGNVIDHAALLNLNVGDPHPQYLLVNGTRAMSDDLDMGTNNITNVGLVDGVDVSAHASRHLPSGSDPITTASAVELTDSTNAEGSAESFARSDHTHSHGNRSGGSLHALVISAGAAGFMSGTDKSKLDNYPTAPSGIDHGALSDLLADDHTQYLLVSGTRAMSGDLDMGTNNITNAGTISSGLINGVSITAHASRHNPGGADALATASAIELTDSTNAEGNATSFARSNHTHSHGNRGGGTLHAAATVSVNGFMSSTDKTKLDGLSATFGTQFQSNLFTTLQASNSGSFVQAHRFTTSSIPAGTYKISYYTQVSRDGGTGRGQIRIQVDDTTDILPLWEETVSNTSARLVVSGTRTITFGSASTHNIDLDIASTSGSNTEIRQWYIEIFRVS